MEDAWQTIKDITALAVVSAVLFGFAICLTYINTWPDRSFKGKFRVYRDKKGKITVRENSVGFIESDVPAYTPTGLGGSMFDRKDDRHAEFQMHVPEKMHRVVSKGTDGHFYEVEVSVDTTVVDTARFVSANIVGDFCAKVEKELPAHLSSAVGNYIPNAADRMRDYQLMGAFNKQGLKHTCTIVRVRPLSDVLAYLNAELYDAEMRLETREACAADGDLDAAVEVKAAAELVEELRARCARYSDTLAAHTV